MKQYWIINNEMEYWCMNKMKPAGSKDIPSNYSYQGYWSKYDDEYSLIHRIKYNLLTGYLEMFFMRLLGNVKTKLVEVI